MTGVRIRRQMCTVGKPAEETQGKRQLSPSPREMPEADSSLAALRRYQPCPHLDFEFPASRTIRQYISVV